jgi:hypothetical protein
MNRDQLWTDVTIGCGYSQYSTINNLVEHLTHQMDVSYSAEINSISVNFKVFNALTSTKTLLTLEMSDNEKF